MLLGNVVFGDTVAQITLRAGPEAARMGTKAKPSVTHLADGFAVSGLPHSAALWKTESAPKRTVAIFCTWAERVSLA
jgi:hypothetical protein